MHLLIIHQEITLKLRNRIIQIINQRKDILPERLINPPLRRIKRLDNTLNRLLISLINLIHLPDRMQRLPRLATIAHLDMQFQQLMESLSFPSPDIMFVGFVVNLREGFQSEFEVVLAD